MDKVKDRDEQDLMSNEDFLDEELEKTDVEDVEIWGESEENKDESTSENEAIEEEDFSDTEEEIKLVSFFEEASEEELEKERQERKARWEEKRKKRQKEIRQRTLIVISAVFLCFLLILGGVFLLKKSRKAANEKKVSTEQVVKKTTLPGVEAESLKDGQRSPVYKVPGWQHNEDGWWYQMDQQSYLANGWKEIEGKIYYFGSDGYTVKDMWFTLDKKDYYFDADGVYQPDAQQKLIAMTFDDGPSSHTQHLLDILEENNSKATFFMVGTQVETYPETVKNMAALGMGIGNHTWDHTYLYKANPHIMYQKFNQVDDKLLELIGKESFGYRSPGGAESDEYRAGCPKPLLLWNVDTLDWKTKDVNSNISIVLEHASEGDIVLMHDLYESTVKACETIIPELKRRGFKLVTIEELAQAKGVTLEAGVDYYSFNNEEQQ